MGECVEKLEFGGRGVYRVVVQGVLPEKYASRLADMSMTRSAEGSEPVTKLVGELRDQAELNGVLETLYGLHLTLISVTRMGVGEH